MGERVNHPPEGSRSEGDGRFDFVDDPTRTAAPVGSGGSGGRPEYAGMLTGRRLARFEVRGLLGAGGFGEVYRARDTRLDRVVAIKVLPAEVSEDPERRERFRREAIAASGLNHPNICTVHDLVEAEGHWLIVMELVEGETLHERLRAGPFPVAEALPIAVQIADALGEAHRAGIVHRDVKCRNIALTTRGQVKVLDFGLAKLLDFGTQPDAQTLEKLTADGTTSGTPGYMSPEQLLARPLDRRSDLFSFGVVLYRMVTGRLPFEGASAGALANAILNAEPHDFGDGPIPEKLKAIVRKLLQKDPGERHSNAEEVEGELKTLEAELAPGRRAGLSRTAWAAVAAGLLVILSVGGWYAHGWSRERWALKATAEITRLLEAEEFTRAAVLIREARSILPKDSTLEKLWMDATEEASVETDPPGAQVSVRPYKGNPDVWESLGTTPAKGLRVPHDHYVWRISRPGFLDLTLLAPASLTLSTKLRSAEGGPPGMVSVAEGRSRLGWPLNESAVLKLDGFLIDRHEVTNEEYRRFVEVGGYRDPRYWKEPFVREGRTLRFDEAMELFRDSTGQPGPATWEVGSYAKEKGKHPVTGVSWFEAAAYAEHAGKSLPTGYHWYRAAQTGASMLIAPGSNFRGTGTRPVGEPGTLSGFGTTDMAGNAKEWCRNETSAGARLILGGGFGDPEYQFNQIDGQSPWARNPSFGFRCVVLPSPPPAGAVVKLEPPFRDYMKETPVSDEVFAAFKGLYAYDKGGLNARVAETDTAEDWIRQKVTFSAAYGNERVIAHLYLPRNGSPPFQPVVFFPGGYAFYQKAFDPEESITGLADFVPKSGRALIFPIYTGTFERQDGLGMWDGQQLAKRRDRMINMSKDLGRTLDYLESREDIDSARMGYLGFSAGGAIAPLLLGVEQRFRAAILLSGGFWFRHPPPEADFINFVTRVRVPVLMLNDRYDNTFPPESSQLPLFNLLGTPGRDKRRMVFETGHGGVPQKDVIRESLAWLDRYLGPVKPKAAAGK